jgi:CBS domain-containing protein
MKAHNLNVKAKEVMNTRVMAVGRKAIGRHMALYLLTGGSSGLPVVERSRALVGVVTEFDLLKAVQDGKDLDSVVAEEIMSKPPITVQEETSVKDVIRRMIKGNIQRVPVVREDKLVGVISRSDLLSHVTGAKVICAYGGF